MSKLTSKPPRKSYDHLPLLPNILAEKVATEVYTGEEMSLQIRDFKLVAETEEKRKKMTHDEVRTFGEVCDTLCRQCYEAKAEWFLKCVRSKTNSGRDQLEVILKHWLCAYLHNPILLTRKLDRKDTGSHLPESPYMGIQEKIARSLYASKLEFGKRGSEQRKLWQKDEDRLREQFKRDAIKEAGLEGHKGAEKAYYYAWQEGHGNGYGEVYICLKKYADFLLGND